jgi:hypothetical protein
LRAVEQCARVERDGQSEAKQKGEIMILHLVRARHSFSYINQSHTTFTGGWSFNRIKFYLDSLACGKIPILVVNEYYFNSGTIV